MRSNISAFWWRAWEPAASSRSGFNLFTLTEPYADWLTAFLFELCQILCLLWIWFNTRAKSSHSGGDTQTFFHFFCNMQKRSTLKSNTFTAVVCPLWWKTLRIKPLEVNLIPYYIPFHCHQCMKVVLYWNHCPITALSYTQLCGCNWSVIFRETLWSIWRNTFSLIIDLLFVCLFIYSCCTDCWSISQQAL